MKLLTKTLIYFIVASSIVFLSGGFLLYEILGHTFYRQIDRDLLTEKAIIEEEIRHDDEIPDYSLRFGHEIEVILYRHKLKPTFTLKDTIIPDSLSNDQYCRYLRVTDNVRTRGYSISILQPLTNRYILFHNVNNTMLSMFLGIMFLSISINYIISRKLWRPFYETIRRINNYDINDKLSMSFPETKITEFEKLNAVLATMSEKIRHDFFNLKEFTENASHEIQTPLAIIKSKLELLLQSEELSTSQMDLITSISMAVTRLSNLNSKLLLITKIDNNQYTEVQPVFIHTFIERTLENLEDFIKNKNLRVSVKFLGRPKLRMDPVLAELLINNLVNNSIKHNCTDGCIDIELSFFTLTISNSGEPLKVGTGDIFDRFITSKKNSGSLGLGLAIVKKICNFYKINVNYLYENGRHTIRLTFS